MQIMQICVILYTLLGLQRLGNTQKQYWYVTKTVNPLFLYISTQPGFFSYPAYESLLSRFKSRIINYINCVTCSQHERERFGCSLQTHGHTPNGENSRVLQHTFIQCSDTEYVCLQLLSTPLFLLLTVLVSYFLFGMYFLQFLYYSRQVPTRYLSICYDLDCSMR